MSEKQEKKPAEAAPAAEKKGKAGGMLAKTPVLVGGVMLIEAVVLFGGFKFLGSAPRTAPGAEVAAAGEHGAEGGHEGAEGAAAAPVDKNHLVEISVLDFRSPNKVSGRTYLYDVSIFAVTKAGSADKVKNILKDREALIQDRIRTIIAQSDPDKLGGGQEPGLETLRRQVKYQLDEIVGEGMIEEVLVPKCIPFRTEF